VTDPTDLIIALEYVAAVERWTSHCALYSLFQKIHEFIGVDISW